MNLPSSAGRMTLPSALHISFVTDQYYLILYNSSKSINFE
jgi:hypothetical protein